MGVIFRAILAFALAAYLIYPREVNGWLHNNLLPRLYANGFDCHCAAPPNPPPRATHKPPPRQAK
jgi:hypothetical protein